MCIHPLIFGATTDADPPRAEQHPMRGQRSRQYNTPGSDRSSGRLRGMSAPSCQLVLHPDPVLREKAQPVEVFDEGLASLVSEMSLIMKANEGVGLAAPQAGHSLQIFVSNSGAEGEQDQVFINPEILEADGPQEWLEEGCLSLPGIRGRVRRPTRVRIRAQDLDGATFELESEEFHARIWQHEFDHLQGVLILDRMRPIDRLATRRALKDLIARSSPE